MAGASSKRPLRVWPRITLVLTILLGLSPPGRDIVYAALFSGEQLSRSIWLPIFLAVVAVLLVLALIECGIVIMINRRRSSAASPHSIPANGRME